MLDWMKKLFNKEEEKTAMNKEVPKQIASQPKIPRVNHYTEAREAQMANRNAGKCRFPLIPDNGFDEEDVRELPNFEEQTIQRGTYEEQPTQRGIKVERSRRSYVETEAPTYEEPELQYEPEPEPVVKKAFVPSQESNRRPFRPTEMISPIYGYNRPSVETKVVQEEEKEREDLEISVEGKAVVDAWLEKKGYTLSDFSGVLQGSSSVKNGVNERSNKVEEKSVVDTWLEKNGYEVERQAPSLEESLSDDLLHKTVGQHVEEEATIVQALKQEQDVVKLSSTEDNEETLQEESIDSKVEHVYSILTEENECNTEIEETVAEVAANQVEEETLEDVVIVKADEKLEETITIEIPDAFEEESKEAEEVELEEAAELEESKEAEEAAELEESKEAEEVVELEESKEAEEVAELEESEEVEEVVGLEGSKEAEEAAELEESKEAEEAAELEESKEAEEVVELEESKEAEEVAELEESEEAEEVAELEESKEAEEVAELEESKEAEEVVELEEPKEAEEVAELEEPKEAEEVVELEGSEEAEEVVELEESKEAEEVVELEEPKEAEEVVELEESEEAEEAVELEESKEAEEVAELEEPKEAEEVVELEGSEEAEEVVELEESEEAEEVAELEESEEAEEAVELEESKEIESVTEFALEETPQEEVIEETMNTGSLENIAVEEQPVISQQETIEFMEESEVFVPVSEADEQTKKDVQSFANVLIEEAEEKKQVVEEQPAAQKEEPKREKKRHVPFNVVMLKQDRKKLMERHAVRTNVTQSTVGERVTEKPMQQVVVETQVEEKPMQQVVVETQAEEKPMQQVVVEAQVEEKPMQQVVVEPQVEEKPMQQVVVAEQVQEKAYVVNQKENDMRNVLQTPPKYEFPPLTLLSIPQQAALDNTEWLEEQEELLNTTFNNFHVGAHVINVSQGPAVTRFEVQPDPGVKVNKITNLSDDIKLSLAAKDIRIEAPIPGKSAIGIEVPNKESKPVFLREILRSPVFTKSESPLTVALGLDISGDPIVTDIRKMPHGLIAGATGSGKSVCINAILTSILYKAKPHEVKLILIDPKMVELAPYNSVPHLVAPVITDVKAATAALKWAVEEMERRYELFAHAGARDLTRYNTIVSGREIPGETLPYIVIVIDELADLMMVAPGDVEEAICRIAQKARACGIHLLVATQRPSVDVITGLIKSNIPTRISFTVSSQVDSRTIIDIGGAEKLLGRGDMLFLGNGTSKPVRVQGVYVSDDEIERTVDHVKKQMKPNYLFKQEDLLAKSEQSESEDELFFDACQFVVEQGGASTSSVQRKFRIGYNRAARLIEEMESQGIISEARGTKPRDVLISEDEFAAMQETNV
ncbi:DNA translocase FtsK [Bacillus mycoides]|uniref:DNA translocase FtsK n=1 Tax=Bacillus mycoides TaxID=1405 RepID=UPI001FDC6D79|nr:DNA translocase FtsK [Bacillus mycoides]CAH2466822.1 Belongs to the FtsK SpoIIIE SftA family [Bacillus mycoides KBAB4]